ncbi:MAG TPA: protein kinase [Terriglobales bacterium]|nr:protein kinase [Terriglobales bacterium]
MAGHGVFPEELAGKTLAHYRIVEKIGAGGMGDVYLAQDEHLDRQVAIKVLSPGTLADEPSRKRFHKEALALSKLNHPNIATIHDFDTQSGVDFLVMEYISGMALSEKLAGRPLPDKEMIRLGLQLADGLAEAHRHGVIHCDLKPKNLMVTADQRLKILDFGLARLRLPVSPTAPTETLTQTTSLAGTLPYMAPEQLLGGQADPRTDIYCTGVVLYEMATGQRPHSEIEPAQLVGAILRKAPLPPTRLNAGISTRLEDIILKCLEKDPENRYQSVRELAVDLRRLLLPTSTAIPASSVPRRRRARTFVPMGIAAAILLVAGAWIWNLGGLRERMTGRGHAPVIRSLAVLPMANLSGDAGQEFLADGMTEALIANLSKIRALKVISRTSVMQYKGVKKALPQIARELGADGILEGSVQRSRGRVVVTAQLIYAPTDTHLWAETYERDLQDVLELQNEVARTVAREIRVALSPEETRHLSSARPVDPEAYEAYLKGRFHWYKLSKDELDNAELYFQLALDRDPDYALAYVGLADVWMARSDTGILAPEQALPEAKAAAAKALQLDESLADAHVTLANLATDDRESETEFRRAIELNPNHAMAHFMYADYLISRRRNQEWEREIQKALELDPLSYFVRCFYGWHLVYIGRYDEAVAEMQRVLITQPEWSSAYLGLWGAYYKKGMDREAAEAAEQFFAGLHDEEAVRALKEGYKEGGYRRAMKHTADVLATRSKRVHVPAVRIARLYAHAGENERALYWLERASVAHESPLAHLAVARDWDGLRSDPRFQALLRRMGLPLT